MSPDLAQPAPEENKPDKNSEPRTEKISNVATVFDDIMGGAKGLWKNLTSPRVQALLADDILLQPLEVTCQSIKEWLNEGTINPLLSSIVDETLDEKRSETQKILIGDLLLACPRTLALSMEIKLAEERGVSSLKEKLELVGHVLYFYDLVGHDSLVAEELRTHYLSEDTPAVEQLSELVKHSETFMKKRCEEYPSPLPMLMVNFHDTDSNSGAETILRGLLQPYFALRAQLRDITPTGFFQAIFEGDPHNSALSQKHAKLKGSLITVEEDKYLQSLNSICRRSRFYYNYTPSGVAKRIKRAFSPDKWNPFK